VQVEDLFDQGSRGDATVVLDDFADPGRLHGSLCLVDIGLASGQSQGEQPRDDAAHGEADEEQP